MIFIPFSSFVQFKEEALRSRIDLIFNFEDKTLAISGSVVIAIYRISKVNSEASERGFGSRRKRRGIGYK